MAESLIAKIWDGHPPRKAKETLGTYLTRCRGRLREWPGAGVEISIQAGGSYTAVADRESIDLQRCHRLWRQAQAIADSGDDEQALTLFKEAEELSREEPLAGLPGEWMERMRISLVEEVRAARLNRIEIELRLGRHTGLIGELRRLSAQHPDDESLARHLMVALYRSDRQADALAVYQETRALLDREHGSEPGDRLREVQQQILRHDARLAALPRRAHDCVDPPHTLPPVPDGFTGREAETAMLVGDQPDGVSVTIIEGMPGIGKTALALHAARLLARQHPDARLYLDLCGHKPGQIALSPATALAELLRMLGSEPTWIPAGLKARSELWQRETAGRRVLLVLDDALDLPQIELLVPRSPGCRVLITTRRRLYEVPRSTRIDLNVLSPADAVALFTTASGGQAEFPAEITGQIVAQLGHLPLAIRLVAVGLRDRYADDAQALLTDLMTSSPHAGDNWQHYPAIATAFELSYRQLTDRQRLLLRRMAANPCPRITLNAVAALGTDPPEALRQDIETLVDHHLASGDALTGYFLHDLTRLFGDDQDRREVAAADRRRSLGRLVEYYLRTADHADRLLHPYRRRMEVKSGGAPALEPPSADTAEEFFRDEWRNILAVAQYAIRHEWKKQGADLINVLSKFLETAGLWEECAAAHEVALQAYRDLGDIPGTGQTLLEIGIIRCRTGHYDIALQNTEEALRLHRGLADEAATAQTLNWTGALTWVTGHAREALANHQEARDIYQRIGEVHGEAESLRGSGIVYWSLGRLHESIQHLTASLTMFQEVGDRRSEAMAFNNLGELQRRRGLHRDALTSYQRSHEIFQKITGRQNKAIIQNNLGTIRHYKGDYPEALREYREALATFEATGDRRNVASVLTSIGTAYQQMEQHSEALIHFGKAREIATAIGERYELARALAGIATVEGASGKHQDSLDDFGTALSLAQSIGDLYLEGQIHEGTGSVVLQTSGPEAARIHLRQALELFQELDVPEARSVAIRLETLGTSAMTAPESTVAGAAT
ncbi:MAG: tetratricopeptide repeat protein [Streptosporangiaceae bacterium]